MRKQLNLNFDKFMEKYQLVAKKGGTGTTTTTPDETPRTTAYG